VVKGILSMNFQCGCVWVWFTLYCILFSYTRPKLSW